MAKLGDTSRGLTKVRADMRVRRRYVLVTVTLGIFLILVTGFTVWFALDAADRLFAPAAPDPARIATFNLRDAAEIPGLEFLLPSPPPTPSPPPSL